ncbi:putative store-operated calcium entry regulator STIMATE [Monocercomonoides exilis]|uniref:putative store-operated calcium entry regulator STIMATE n=1 Tax=Monocercomonoides exilis TaxID=2049356 RepID=UPI0035594E86|nr:putative store-operated calcium entry regulator STIMATE [Monocercomonoides exilis]
MTNENTCELTGTLSWISQAILFFVAFIAVILIRHFERPQRPFVIWLFDMMKQTMGTVIQHFASIGLALFFTKEISDDPCIWYLTNYHADCIIGTIFNYFLNAICDKCFEKFDSSSLIYLKSGNYGIPPKCSAFGGQFFVWSIIVTFSKALTTIIVYFLSTPLNWISSILIWPLNFNKDAKIFILMAVEPIIVSSLVFIVQDFFLKRGGQRAVAQQQTTKHYVSLEDQNTNDILSQDEDQDEIDEISKRSMYPKQIKDIEIDTSSFP